jgi:hypothetical protein
VARWEPDSEVGVAGLPNTWDRAGRDRSRDCVGIVSRRATGLEDGVEGRVGGTLKSCIRLIELLWVFARDAAVGSSYRAGRGSGEGGRLEPEA